NLCRESLDKGNRQEQEALSNCRLIVYSNEWAARTAIENYDVAPEKVKMVSYGPMIDCSRTEDDVRKIVASREHGICRLLFAGVNWYRKGGNIALRVAELLNARGVRTELHVLGCETPRGVPDYVVPHGFVSKRSPDGVALIDALFSSS